MKESSKKTGDGAGHSLPPWEMRQSMEEWRKLVTTIPDYIALHDVTGRYLFLNHYAEGFSEKDVIGKSLYDFISEDSRETYHHFFESCLGSKQTQRFEYSAPGNNMDVRIYDNYLVPRVEKDLVVEVMAIAMDITERKVTEEALRLSQAELKAIYDYVPVLLCVVDEHRHILFANPAFTEFTGVTEDDLKGGRACGVFGCINALNHPQGCGFGSDCVHCSLKLAMEDTLATGTAHRNVEYHTTLVHNGQSKEITMLGSTALVHGVDRDQMLLCLHDITERKQAEEMLRKSEERFRRVSATISDISYSCKKDHNGSYFIDWMTGAVERITGYSIPEIINMGCWGDIVIEKDIELFRQNVARLAPGSSANCELRLKRKTGETIWVTSYAESIPDLENSGNCTVYGVLVDITMRKQSDAQFRDIVEKNPMSIQILDMNGYTIQTNPAHTKLFGVKTPPDYSIFKDAQLLKQGLGELFDRIKRGEVMYFPDSHFNVHDVDPSFPDVLAWIKAVGFTLNDEDGVPDRVVLMHENITERKHAEAMFQDIVEKNPISIQIVDKEGCTVDTNPAFIRLFGLAPPPGFSIFADLQRKSPELEKVIGLVKSGEVVNLPDLYYNPRDVSPDSPDNPLWIRAIIFPLKDLHGKPERYVLMHENITERKNAEIALKKKSDELEQFNHLMIGREIKMIELKQEVNELLKKAGYAEKYTIHK